MNYTFPEQVSCPKCDASFSEAEQQKQYEPVVVVVCPSCSTLLWLPGLDNTSKLFEFDGSDETL
ncbi:MAG: hypothetical protein H6707_19285 [Deltaproteobacteria bacterium]|nr:hypothetical protein [Deltaproteobacteria bacterium]